MWTHSDRGRGPKSQFLCGRHKWMTPYGKSEGYYVVCRGRNLLITFPNPGIRDFISMVPACQDLARLDGSSRTQLETGDRLVAHSFIGHQALDYEHTSAFTAVGVQRASIVGLDIRVAAMKST